VTSFVGDYGIKKKGMRVRKEGYQMLYPDEKCKLG
jgi:hypothetical protein